MKFNCSIYPSFLCLVVYVLLLSSMAEAQVKEVYIDKYRDGSNSILGLIEALQSKPQKPEPIKPNAPDQPLYKGSPMYSKESYCQRRADHFSKVLLEFERRGGEVENDEEYFWKKHLKSNYTVTRYNELGKYLGTEEGQIIPIRTGYETRFYNLLKDWIYHSGVNEKLSLSDVFSLGVTACKDYRNKANYQEVFLTIHNVIRMLARPEQVLSPAPKTIPADTYDSMDPVVRDIKSESSSSRNYDMWSLLKYRKDRFPEFQNLRSVRTAHRYPLLTLFNRKTGIFEVLEDCEQAGPATGNTGSAAAGSETVWNGGSHYYFWIGALAQSTMGYASLLYGGEQEEFLKWLGSWSEKGLDKQGEVEVAHMYCGGTVVSDLLTFDKLIAPGGNASTPGGGAPAQPPYKTVSFQKYSGKYTLSYGGANAKTIDVQFRNGKMTFSILYAPRGLLTKGGGEARYVATYKDLVLFEGTAKVFNTSENRYMTYYTEIWLWPDELRKNQSEHIQITYKGLHRKNTPGTPDGGEVYKPVN